MKVAVVRNREKSGIISRFGQACPEVYGAKTIQKVVAALQAGGHTVAELEGDKTLLGKLEEFMPADTSGQPGGLVYRFIKEYPDWLEPGRRISSIDEPRVRR
jgi:D-alanine-D-alanine ligase